MVRSGLSVGAASALLLAAMTAGCAASSETGAVLAAADGGSSDSCRFQVQGVGEGPYTHAVPVAKEATSLCPLQIAAASQVRFALLGTIASPSDTTCEFSLADEHGGLHGIGYLNAKDAWFDWARAPIYDGNVHYWKVFAYRVVFVDGKRAYVSTDDANENFVALVAFTN